MDKNSELLDIVVDYINENGLYGSFLEWAAMYDYDPDVLDRDIEKRYDNLCLRD